MVLRVAVVDDEDVQRAELVSMVERFAREGGLGIATVEFSDGRDLLASGDADKLDIILLDIEMADVDGMKAARRLRTAGVTSQIVFVTNMAQYAIKGYEVGAIDFIVKPVRYASFAFKLRRAVEAACARRPRTVWLGSAGEGRRVRTDDIIFVEVRGHRLIYHTVRGDVELWDTMRHAIELLGGAGFALCNVCYLVNLDRVTRLEGETVYVGDQGLKISRGKRREFVDALTRSMGECR
mgnify:CR=1 FL=1